MMRTVFLLPLMCAFTAAQTNSSRVSAQDDRPPLAEQCVADYSLWHNASKSDIEELPLSIIQARYSEMWKCASVVRSPERQNYSTEMLLLTGTYAGHINHRALDFIERHGLMKQFVQEDSQGKGR